MSMSRSRARRFPLLLAACAAPLALSAARAQETLPYRNPDLPLERRVDDLIGRMTLEEKVNQMTYTAPAIPRLGVPQYNWWNEALHGVARAGVATVFPQAIGLAATWDTDLMHRVAGVIGDEGRAKYHEAVREGKRDQYYGLTFWSPNINIFRDPRWGRGQETYGEDPYLTGQMGVQFVRGLQGDDPRYYKVIATLKHYAVHSGPEPARHQFDARVDERDLRETYLPAFRAGILDGKAASVMGAYNRTNGVPCCASPRLLDRILRTEWGFRGYVVSDCGAITDIYRGHHYAGSAAEAAADAVRAGDDLDTGQDYRALVQAVQSGLVSEAEIDRSVKRLFTARFRLGMFDPDERVPYAQIPYSVNDSAEHRALALQAARESTVLLRNVKDALPLRKSLQRVAVIGPNADDVEVLLGNYNGTPSHAVTPLAGIRAKLPGAQVTAARGCEHTRSDAKLLAEAVESAKNADVAICVLGLSPRLEGEEMRVNAAGFSGGDRTSLDLPQPQEELLEAVAATGKPVVLVLLNGSALSVNWAARHVPAIVEAWYPGEESGTALADVLFGDYNPAGRLPVTFYRSVDQLPPFEDYRMAGRTYRYFTGEPLYPFGHGLSYTRFRYGKLRVGSDASRITGTELQVTAEVKNDGAREGDEVVQLYVSRPGAPVPVPIRSLQGVRRVHLQPGEKQTVSFTLTPRQLSMILDDGRRVETPGEVEISVGGKQPGQQGDADARTTGVVTRRVTLAGEEVTLEP